MKPYYERGGITIYHGDCREVLPTLDGVQAIISDPRVVLRDCREQIAAGSFVRRHRIVRTHDSTAKPNAW